MNISINQYKNTLKLIKQKAKEIYLTEIYIRDDISVKYLALEIEELANKGLINSIGHSKDLKEATKQAILGTKKTNLSLGLVLLPKFLIINKRLYKRLKWKKN